MRDTVTRKKLIVSLKRTVQSASERRRNSRAHDAGHLLLLGRLKQNCLPAEYNMPAKLFGCGGLFLPKGLFWSILDHMCAEIIDLRNINKNKETGRKISDPAQFENPENDAPEEETSGGEYAIEWSAYDRPLRTRKKYWYLPPGGVALVLILFGILAQSYFFIALVVVALAVFLMYYLRESRLVEFKAGAEGIRVGTQFYRIADVKSFWIFDHVRIKELSLETTSIIYPFLHIPLGKMKPEEVREALRPIIPEKEHQESLMDRITDLIGI